MTPQLTRAELTPPGVMLVLVTDNIEADWARALAAGASAIAPPERKPWGETAGFLRDVNGLIVELCAAK